MLLSRLFSRFIATLCIFLLSYAHAWHQVGENAAEPAREFRAAWVASVLNLDWPSKAGLAAEQQRRELIQILNRAAQLRFNAIILQVRPTSDALYKSAHEPWSAWLSGPGINPGYDPLAFAISEAHKRGIEVHAWFNPFRATFVGRPVGSNHISLRQPKLILSAGKITLLNPSNKQAQAHVLNVILDVVKRYDIDGVHLDDYFYPYPPNNKVADGLTPAQRRAAVDFFVNRLYSGVKSLKPWVRVGISPFGIWRPNTPAGIQAGVDAYEHLACDARKWLINGWVDYLAPQLYWACEGPQSFTTLMKWWSSINPSRPVWPGISLEKLTTAEIGRQIDYSRRLARQSAGQLYFRWGFIGSNRGNIQRELTARYQGFAVPPAMPWSGTARPGKPTAQAQDTARGTSIVWTPADASARKWVIQARYSGRWATLCILPGSQRSVTLPPRMFQGAERIAIRPISACGNSGAPAVLAR